MSDSPPIEPPNGGVTDTGGPELPDNIEPIEIQTEMETSFLEYAMSVIISRALPDARDGLKPVHRRILWSMYDAGHRPDRQHVKCATVVGDVIGHYHPHGDTAIYDALVRMGQTFSLRHTLIDPHGNFGSPEDPPAAYRYTECRLTPLAMQLLADIDENTVDFAPNFDGKLKEPTVLPSRFPNLLVNGSQGIAVGMATNIPPHNLAEVIDATVHLIDHPEATSDDLMQFVHGPDFPTRAQILGRVGIRDAYRTGRGSIRLRAVAEIQEGRTNDRIVVTEIPYQVSVEQIERKVAELVERGELAGIRAINNESAKGQTRLVFELKRDATALVVLNNLYKHTPMQTSFGVNMVALVDGIPRTLNLRDALVAYVDHQLEVVRRRSQYRLEKAQRRAHIVEGLLKALDMIDAIIACHPGQRGSPRGQGTADGGGVRVLGRAGRVHPGHDPVPPHPAGPGRAGGGAGHPAGHHRRAGGHPGRRREAALGDQAGDAGHQGPVRRRAPHGAGERSGRARHRGSHRRRGPGGHVVVERLHQVGVGRGVPYPGPGGSGGSPGPS